MRFDRLSDARPHARTVGLRERVVCYVTRGRRDLLVFEHTEEYPDAGVQVPGGGLEDGETPGDGAARELREEAGLLATGPAVYLGSAVQAPGPAPQMHHYFWLEASADAPDGWEHLAEGRFVFRHRFTPLADARLDHGLDALLPELTHAMKEHA